MSFQLAKRRYPVREKAAVAWQSAYPLTFDAAAEYSMILRPFSGFMDYQLFKQGKAMDRESKRFFDVKLPLTQEDDRLTTKVSFPQEDKYIAELFAGETLLTRTTLYALEEDLYHTLPLKGDCHLHTCVSDGTESPEMVAAHWRRIGFDFVAITDHREYRGSVQAKEKLDPLGTDFLILNGEEVHSPGNPVHIISLGAGESITDWYREDSRDYDAAVAQKLQSITQPLDEKQRYYVAASMAVFDRIRQAGGLSVLCHTHWVWPEVMQQTEGAAFYLMDHRCFDAYELLSVQGGHPGTRDEASTQMQLSAYHGYENYPVLGNSDSHMREHQGNFTLVFAREYTEEGVKDAVRRGMTVAGNAHKLYGNLRLVKYAYFWLDELAPLHDRACVVQGIPLEQYAAGKTDVDFSDVKTAVSDYFHSV